MRIHGVLTEDEVDQIILDHLHETYNIDRSGRKHHVELKWTRGPIEFLVTNPLPNHETASDFLVTGD